MHLFYFPIYLYCIFLVLRNRSFFFFVSSNPKMEFGGLIGESKKKILDLIPSQYIPLTFKIAPNTTLAEAKAQLTSVKMDFPIIAKPDVGERGRKVSLLKNEADLETYLDEIQEDFLIQERVSYPVEMGVFYYRLPGAEQGKVTSIVLKELLSVTGDGQSPVAELMQKNVRSKMHFDTISSENPALLAQIPLKGESVELVSIGNHCRGTTFLNGNHLITEELSAAIDKLSKQIDGFHYGRYDLRCRSVGDLCKLEHFKIMELNGCGAEPAHIYQPGFSLFKAYMIVIRHLNIMSKISRMNRKWGYSYLTFSEGLKEVQRIRKESKRKRG